MSENSSSDLNDLRGLVRPYDSLGDSVIVADKDGIILYANKGATTLYGYAAGELLGKPLDIFDLEGDSPIDFEAIMKAPGQMWEREVIRVRKNGTGGTALRGDGESLPILPRHDRLPESLSIQATDLLGFARKGTNRHASRHPAGANRWFALLHAARLNERHPFLASRGQLTVSWWKGSLAGLPRSERPWPVW